jgi:outer membrane murein-binding lipoprotein Lpp
MKTRNRNTLAMVVVPAVLTAGLLSGCESSTKDAPETNKSASAKRLAATQELALLTTRAAIKAYRHGDASYEFIAPKVVPNGGTVELRRPLFDASGNLASLLSIKFIGQDERALHGEPDVQLVDAWTGTCPTDELTEACKTESRATLKDLHGMDPYANIAGGLQVSIEQDGSSYANPYNSFDYCLDVQATVPACGSYSVKQDATAIAAAHELIDRVS